MKLARCLVAITTPFDANDAVDVDALQRHATWLVDEGVTGIIVAGTTGEAATMSGSEKLVAMNAVWEAVSHRATLILGAGNNSTSESTDFVERVNAEAKAHGIMSVVPYYNKPNQRGIVAHFEAIADVSDLPVMIYNVPGRTVVGMTIETMVAACRHPNIVAIKEASADLHMGNKLLDALPSDITVLSGDDATAMPLIALGAAGVVSVAGNVAPRLLSTMCAAIDDGDLGSAQALSRRVAHVHDLMFRYASPLAAKAIAARFGFGNGVPRLPLAPLTDEERAGILRDAELLEISR